MGGALKGAPILALLDLSPTSELLGDFLSTVVAVDTGDGDDRSPEVRLDSLSWRA